VIALNPIPVCCGYEHKYGLEDITSKFMNLFFSKELSELIIFIFTRLVCFEYLISFLF
jgi:hypothetical protein